ncbi:MAG: hypothetical protein QXE78_10420 [Nitrososphaeria archaeon]
MSWRGFRGRYGMWPGRGPFSYLPPWQRPGWLFGRGACWWFLQNFYMYGYPFYPSVLTRTLYMIPYLPRYYWR